MTVSCISRARVARAALTVAAVVAVIAVGPEARAASGLALLSQAEHNTNTVRTLIHSDSITQSQGPVKVVLRVRGEEDEAANRERDTESVTVYVKQKGKTTTRHYTATIIFANGNTFLHTSQTKGWQMRKGTVIADPASGEQFKRARTTVPTYTIASPQVVSSSSSLVEVSGTTENTPVKGTIRLWISPHPTPYVVREEIAGSAKTPNGVIHTHQVSTFGPFNRKLKIQIPVIGSTSST